MKKVFLAATMHFDHSLFLFVAKQFLSRLLLSFVCTQRIVCTVRQRRKGASQMQNVCPCCLHFMGKLTFESRTAAPNLLAASNFNNPRTLEIYRRFLVLVVVLRTLLYRLHFLTFSTNRIAIKSAKGA